MDLLISLNDTKVKIRVVGLIKTKKGYIFEKSEKGYIFAIGGKIILNESSKDAIIREIKEEIGMDIKEASLISVFENFYGKFPEKVQEICFVYEVVEEFTGNLGSEFVEVQLSDLNNYDVRPNVIKEILLSKKNNFKHFIIKPNEK